MRAVMLEVPDALLEERRRLGQDVFDEMWEGELHMVPPPSYVHQTIGSQLLGFLYEPLRQRGIEMRYETGVFRRDDDYRVPDLSFFPAERADLIATEGLRGALAVLEIRSPDDETYKKFGFYASLGIREVIVIHRDTRAVEVYRLVEQTYLATAADERGRYHAATIDVRFSTVAGPFLRVEHAGATREI